jgi:aromatic ring-opening dioxygenase catalytic subunit (LigB family)
MPLLGQQPDLVRNWLEMRKRLLREPLGSPRAIVVLSAHWESAPVKVTSSLRPEMLYDYYGFPDESYAIQYPAPGDPELAARIQQMLRSSNVPALADCQLDPKRGFDHGVFVPLKVLFPQADVPVVCVSLHGSMSPEINMAIGQALAPLRDDNILLLGSGLSYHNMERMMRPTAQSHQASVEFNSWLKETMLTSDVEGRLDRLKRWDRAPGARMAHPREDHLMPLLAIAGAASDPQSKVELVYEGAAWNGKHEISGFLFA